jgi:hypothetical protein
MDAVTWLKEQQKNRKPDHIFRSSDAADHFRNIELLVSFELVRNRETLEITDQAVSGGVSCAIQLRSSAQS